MRSSVLSSRRAVQMNILIIRTFIKLREMLATHKDLDLDIYLSANVFRAGTFSARISHLNYIILTSQ